MAKTLRKIDREFFLKDLGKVISHCESEGKAVGLLVVQVEQLDKVEGAFGYEVSHQLLKQFGIRLEGFLRNSDRIALIGDRKFCFILSDLMNEGHAILAATKIDRLAKEPFEICGHAVKLKTSIGIAVFPDHASNADDLIRRSELALVSAQDGDKPFATYSNDATQTLATLWHIESDLDNALEESQLELHYQPKIDLSTGFPCGAEALIRWNHPVKGLVPPELFIPVAERTGLLEPITMHAINVAFREQSEWPDAWGTLSVAINLSANVLTSEQLIATIQDSARIWGSDSQRLVLEITEDALIKDPDESISILRQLRSEGIRISIDDFGTGYSSMSYFKDMPADELKIDKSFVLNMLNDKRDKRIVRMVIKLAHTFGFKVVAEGVEDQAILDELIALNCDTAQGFLYTPPLPQKDFIEWLMQYRPSDSIQKESVSSETPTVAPVR